MINSTVRGVSGGGMSNLSNLTKETKTNLGHRMPTNYDN